MIRWALNKVEDVFETINRWIEAFFGLIFVGVVFALPAYVLIHFIVKFW